MEKYSEVIGLPVVCVENGKRIGVIEDMVFFPQEKKVAAFVLERRGYRISREAILLKDIISLGKDALIVNNDLCVTQFSKLKHIKTFKHRAEIKGLRIYTKSGEDLGIVKDILFDYKTGKIEGVEISDGILHDIFQGRNILPLFGRVEFGDENILVDREAVEEMTNTGGGLKNIIDN